MTREELIDKLTKAMFRQEHGKDPKSVWLCNPGNLRYWSTKHPLRGRDGQIIIRPTKPVAGAFVDFLTWALGHEGKALTEGWRVFRALISQYVDGKYTNRKPPTLREMLKVYAPSSDGNDPKVYTTNVASWAGINPDVVLKDLITDDDLPSAA